MLCHKAFYSERCEEYTGFNKPKPHEQVYIAVSSNARQQERHVLVALTNRSNTLKT